MNKKIILASCFILIFIFSAGISFYLKAKSGESVKSLQSINLLSRPVILFGNKSIAQSEIKIDNISLSEKNIMQINYNLNGLCLLKGDAASLNLDQGNTSVKIILSDFLENCSTGIKSTVIPFAQINGLNIKAPVKKIGFSIWYPAQFQVDILNVSISELDENVLGAYSFPQAHEGKKNFQFTPLRPYPYASRSPD